MTSITQETMASADTLYMATKHNTPILDTVLRQHREDDTRLAVALAHLERALAYRPAPIRPEDFTPPPRRAQ